MGIMSTGAICKGFVIGKEGEPGRLYSKNYGVYITGEGVYDTPERDDEMVCIPGRNGALYRNKGAFKNIEVTYHCGMVGDAQTDFAQGIASFRNALLLRSRYLPLYDDYNPDEYRMAVYRRGLEITPVAYGQAGQFDITFECKPQRFLKSGDTELTWSSSGQSATNPTGWNASPIIKFKMTGATGTITLGGNGVRGVITINGAPLNTEIIVDCEVGEAYTGYVGQPTASMNQYVDLGAKLPYLGGGSTRITYTSNVTNLKVTPRWWRI